MPSPCPHLVSRPLAGGRVDLLLTIPEMQAGGPSLLRVHPHPDSASHTLSSRLPLKLRAASSRDPRPTPGPSSPRCIFLLPPVRAAPPPLCPLGSHFTGGQGLLGQGGVDLHSPGTQLGLRDCPKLCVCVFAHECVHACTGVYACVRSRVGAGPGIQVLSLAGPLTSAAGEIPGPGRRRGLSPAARPGFPSVGSGHAGSPGPLAGVRTPVWPGEALPMRRLLGSAGGQARSLLPAVSPAPPALAR